MENSKKTLELKFERTIPAPPDEVFDGWLNPKIPGNPWNMAEKLLLNPKVDGFFYWLIKGNSHYGRLQVALNVNGQSLDRGNVYHATTFRFRRRRRKHNAVDTPQKRCQSFPRACRS